MSNPGAMAILMPQYLFLKLTASVATRLLIRIWVTAKGWCKADGSSDGKSKSKRRGCIGSHEGPWCLTLVSTQSIYLVSFSVSRAVNVADRILVVVVVYSRWGGAEKTGRQEEGRKESGVGIGWAEKRSVCLRYENEKLEDKGFWSCRQKHGFC